MPLYLIHPDDTAGNTLRLKRFPLKPCTEPEAFTFHSALTARPDNQETHPLAHRLRFRSSYRGEATYEFAHPTLGEITLRYRHAKDFWRGNPQEDGRRHWNFENRDAMEAEINSSLGILMVSANEPADPETLKAFQEITGHHEAKTGFFCHLRNRTVACRPPKPGTSPSRKTWQHKIELAIRDLKTLCDQGERNQAIRLAERLPTFLNPLRAAVEKILPEWGKVTVLPIPNTPHPKAA